MESSENYPFILHWVWGHQANIASINVSTQKEKKIFFVSGPVGVCFDWVTNKQHLFIGHKNDIIAIAATPDKKYLVSVDRGEGNALIIWHTQTRCMFFVISDYFPVEGVISMCFSSDGNQLITLSGGKPQELAIWNWRNKKEFPDFTYTYRETAEFQHYISFHTTYPSHFTSCGGKTVYFFQKEQDDFKSAVLDIKDPYDEEVANRIGNFTQTAFSPLSSLAVSATSKGMIVLWGRPLYSREKPAQDSIEWFVMNPQQRVCIRLLQAMKSKCSIPFLSVSDNYIIAGTGKGEVLYYDEDFNIQWSKNFGEGQINGISYTFKPKLGFRRFVKKLMGKETKTYDPDSPIKDNDFMFCTTEGYAGYFTVSTLELTRILCDTSDLIKSVAVHPLWPYVYFGDYGGTLQKWDYKSKQLINKEIYDGISSGIEIITIDGKGAYAACAMSNGNVAIFDAVCFSAKPCFTSDEVLHKPVMINFSPDSQHLLITDVSSYITHYRLQLLVVPKEYQMMIKEKIPPEEPVWSFGGKTRQHQARIVDSMFNHYKKCQSLLFYTLGEDRFLVEYNISSSKGLDIDVSKHIILEKRPVPTCMALYPWCDVPSLIAVLNDDGKMRIYSTETDKIVRMVSLPIYEEPIKKIIYQTNWKYMLKKEFPDCTDVKDLFKYFIFNCSHMIGLAKYPIDGNPNTSLGLRSTPSGINTIVPNREQTVVFTTGSNDSWIFMYEINIMAVLEAEREGGDGIEAFKYLFPSSCNPDEMEKRLIHSVYSLELEMKMLKFGEEEKPVLSGEIPINFLEYVLAALGCFVSPADLQMMLKDIEFENRYQYDGKKTTLTCLDIMKLYVNYRPFEPITKTKLRDTFRDILAREEDPDQMPRARFIDILSTRGDTISLDELVKILTCLQDKESAIAFEEYEDSSSEDERDVTEKDESEASQTATTEHSDAILKKLIPEAVTEEIFFQDILCLEKAEEDLSKYILKKEDYKFVQAYPTLDEFVTEAEKIHEN